MKPAEIKKLIISSLSPETDSEEIMNKLDDAGVSYSFREGFRDRVLDRIFTAAVKVNREVDYIRSMNSVFYRIALTGVAAIVILLISIFLKEGSLSFNSFVGLTNNYDESIICLLTGK